MDFMASSWWTIAGILLAVTLLAAVILDPLISLILHPIILPFPWPFSKDDSDDAGKAGSSRKVVFAASFNPPHKGHLAMLEYLAQRYDKVLVVIGRNPDKHYDVTPDQRAELVRTMLQSRDDSHKDSKLFDPEKIQVKVVEGYIWRTVQREGAQLFFRGIRTWEKDGPEERALQILNTWGPLVLGPLWWPIPTIFLQGNPEYNHISSTLIREICQAENDTKKRCDQLQKLVPKSISKDVAVLYGKGKKKD
jgi:pantetheine-phosphate adenylyltransferase